MKKFIAGIVMTGLMFMALATGAFAKSNSSYPSGGVKSCYSSGSSYYKSQYDYSYGC